VIVRDKPSVYRLFFIFRGSIVPNILPKIVFITALSALVTATHHHFSAYFPTFTIASFTVLGVALSLFLGFRNNACYDRWWEAR
jgi:putative membrane protein